MILMMELMESRNGEFNVNKEHTSIFNKNVMIFGNSESVHLTTKSW